jgi:hypothetical protein
VAEVVAERRWAQTDTALLVLTLVVIAERIASSFGRRFIEPASRKNIIAAPAPVFSIGVPHSKPASVLSSAFSADRDRQIRWQPTRSINNQTLPCEILNSLFGCIVDFI